VKKWAIRLLFAGAVTLLLATPWLLAKHNENRAAQDMPSFESVVPPPLHEKGPRVVYKWQDDKGVWHYADQPPANHAWKAITIAPGNSLAPAAPKKNEPVGSASAPLGATPGMSIPENRPVQINPFSRLAERRHRETDTRAAGPAGRRQLFD